jgi:hypothetical protein
MHRQETVQFVESCGKFSYIATPGCNFVCGLLGQVCGHFEGSWKAQ